MGAQRSRDRLQSIDLLRGAVMIVMALDHVRDFVHAAATQFRPEDLTRTSEVLFFTRWITHFCAPVFMFTAGLGAFFWMRNRRGKSELAKFLLTRGLWLIVLEVTVLRFGLLFTIRGPLLLTILWALGLSMVTLAALVYLPARVLAGVSIAMIALHNLLDRVPAAQFGGLGWIWDALHQQAAVQAGGITIVFAYPLIPWPAVMAAGYCLGTVFLWDEERRRRLLVPLGIGLTLAFVAVRALNIYGDPVPWSAQRSAMFTVMSFLNCNKYPPSLDFLLMTLGPAIAALGWLGRVRVGPKNPVLVFGRVPLFYFLVHIYLGHAIAVALRGGQDLWVVYVVWAAVVAALYPMSLWFAGVKERRKDWWLGYL
ncbi:MAG: heparan-alpha-glucosaminide N-acetyltransferase domain-containing protein [Acidobacteriota bacterium]|nr:heparan-alpha-glucosaminide N-acetyltransferase domain-containing protein [Acidobacteriota bacterium]